MNGFVAGPDIAILLGYLVTVFLAGIYMSRGMKTSVDYFLASRAMPWYWIAASIWATNIDFVHGYLGHGAAAYNWGIVQANFEWFQGPINYILAGIFFISFFWRAGVYTVSEFMERRFNATCRTVYAVAMCILLLIVISGGLYIAGLALKNALGWDFWTCVLVLTLVTGIYTLFGGLTAVIMTDVMQFFIMFLATMPLYPILLHEIGGAERFMEVMTKVWRVSPEYFNVMPNAHHPYSPGPWIILGLCLSVSLGWCVTHQAMIQRNLGARSMRDSKLGYVVAAIPKTLGAWLYMIPMVAAPVYFWAKGIFVGKADETYALLIFNILPTGMRGIFLAGLFAAGMSSIAAMLNSVATLFVKDIYERHLVRRKPDTHYFRAGQVATFGAILVALGLVPYVENAKLLMTLAQTLNALILVPTIAVILLGIFWRRTSLGGATFGFITGFALGIVMHLLLARMTFFELAWWVLVYTVVVTVLVSLVTKPPGEEKIRRTTWGPYLSEEIAEKIRARSEGATPMPEGIRYRVPLLRDIRVWATAILLFQVILLLYYG